MSLKQLVCAILVSLFVLLGGCKVTIIEPGYDSGVPPVTDGGSGTPVSDGYLICEVGAMCGGRDMCFEVDLRDSVEGTYGALCTHACANDGECMAANGFSGACYALQGDASSFCFQRCDTDSDCFVQNICISVTLPGGVVDGICTPNNLGGGGVGPYCGDGVQDVGEECDDGNNIDGDGCSSMCVQESDGYLSCEVGAMCGGRDMCFEVDLRGSAEGTYGALCTHACASDGECMPANSFTGACYALQGDATSYCFQRCDLDADCFVNNVCISVSLPGGAVDGVCVPDNL